MSRLEKTVWGTAIAISLLKLFLVIKYPLGVSPDLARTVLGWGLSETALGVWGWLIQITTVTVLVVRGTREGRAWLALIAAASPWLNGLALFYPWESLTLLSILVVFLIPRRVIKIVAGGVLVASIWFNRLNWVKANQDSLSSQLNLQKLTDQVDQTQKINYEATGKTYILPAWFRKVVYNKLVFAGQTIAKRAVATVDFDQWTAPLSAWAVTGLSGLPPKGLSPLFYFFEVPLLLWGVSRLTKSEWSKWGGWLAGGIAGGMYLEKKFFTVGGALLLPFAAYTISRLLLQTKLAWQYLFIGLYLAASVYLFKQLFFQQSSYRYSDAYLYRQTAMWLKNNSGAYDRAVVTTRFGPMDTMLQFYNVFPDPRIEVREFNLKTETPTAGTVYIGLPKEVAGAAENDVKLKIDADDELVFGYGKGLWVIKTE